MAEIEIEYGVSGELLGPAIDVQRGVLSTLGQRIDAVTLRPADGDAFAVRLDGDLVFDGEEDDYNLNDIVRDVRDRL